MKELNRSTFDEVMMPNYNPSAVVPAKGLGTEVWDTENRRYLDLAGGIAVADFVCPTEQTRLEFEPDYTVWMDTIKEGRFEDTNKMFENPPKCNYHVAKWFDDTDRQLSEVFENFKEKHSGSI